MENRTSASPEGQGTPPRVLNGLDYLRTVHWSSLSSIESVRDRDDVRVSELAEDEKKGRRQHFENVVYLAHYAFELSGDILPLAELRRAVEAHEDFYAVLAYATSRAVALELSVATRFYEPLRDATKKNSRKRLGVVRYNLRELTRSYTPMNTGVLHALYRIRSSNSARPTVPEDLGRDTEQVLRMLIAKDQGLIQDYSQLLRIPEADKINSDGI